MYCKFCLITCPCYFTHVVNNKAHTENLKKNYDLIIKNQYSRKLPVIV